MRERGERAVTKQENQDFETPGVFRGSSGASTLPRRVEAELIRGAGW